MTDTVAGFIGGILSIYVGLPLDTIKVRLQVKGPLFNTTFGCATNTIKVEGITALWKGALPAVTVGIVENAVVFSANGLLYKIFCRPNEKPGFLKQCALNGGSAIFSGFAICPPEVIKCRLQTNIGFGVDSGVIHTVRWLYRREGVFGFFRGLVATWSRDIPFYMVFFGSYTYYKNLIVEHCYSGRDNMSPDNLPGWHYAFGGGVAGSIAWFSIFPIDVVKSIQQTSATRSSFYSTLRYLYAEQGLRYLYRGCWPCVLRGFPVNGVLFLTVEYTKIMFHHFGFDAGRSLGSSHGQAQGE